MNTTREEHAVKNAADDAKNVAKEVGKDVKDAAVSGYETAKAKVAEGYEKVSEQAHKVWDNAADTTLHDVEHSVAVFIRKNPGKSLLLAAGAGLVIGAICRVRFS